MTGDRALTVVVWLGMFGTLTGLGLGQPGLVRVAAPVGIAAFLVWAWQEVKRRRAG